MLGDRDNVFLFYLFNIICPQELPVKEEEHAVSVETLEKQNIKKSRVTRSKTSKYVPFLKQLFSKTDYVPSSSFQLLEIFSWLFTLFSGYFTNTIDQYSSYPASKIVYMKKNISKLVRMKDVTLIHLIFTYCSVNSDLNFVTVFSDIVKLAKEMLSFLTESQAKTVVGHPQQWKSSSFHPLAPLQMKPNESREILWTKQKRLFKKLCGGRRRDCLATQSQLYGRRCYNCF